MGVIGLRSRLPTGLLQKGTAIGINYIPEEDNFLLLFVQYIGENYYSTHDVNFFSRPDGAIYPSMKNYKY